MDIDKHIADIYLEKGAYELRFCTNQDEVNQVLSLRYLVFNKELGAGVDHHDEIDKDEFDEVCHHLILIHKSTQKIIGTYRMQTYEMSQENKGFYTNHEFVLSKLSQSILEEAIEIGRVCIHQDHRRLDVLLLLLRGISAYMKAHNKSYFLGCCSFVSQSTEDAEYAWTYFKEKNYFHPDILLPAQEKYHMNIEKNLSIPSGYKMNQLIQVYLKYGAKICSYPALDKAFGTIDFMVIINTKTMNKNYYNYFFK